MFDLGDIGALAVPTPTTYALSKAVRGSYRFLADIDGDERQLAKARLQDRPLALRLLEGLLGSERLYRPVDDRSPSGMTLRRACMVGFQMLTVTTMCPSRRRPSW